MTCDSRMCCQKRIKSRFLSLRMRASTSDRSRIRVGVLPGQIFNVAIPLAIIPDFSFKRVKPTCYKMVRAGGIGGDSETKTLKKGRYLKAKFHYSGWWGDMMSGWLYHRKFGCERWSLTAGMSRKRPPAPYVFRIRLRVPCGFFPDVVTCALDVMSTLCPTRAFESLPPLSSPESRRPRLLTSP